MIVSLEHRLVAIDLKTGQDITDEQQIEFTRNFGPLQDGANATERREQLRLDPAFAECDPFGDQQAGAAGLRCETPRIASKSIGDGAYTQRES